MKITNETQAKIQYVMAAITDALKLTIHIFVLMPALHYGYTGLNSIGWVTYTATYYYESAAYLLALLWLELLVLALVGVVGIVTAVLIATKE